MGTKLSCRTLWISDVHLGNKSCHAEALLKFLSCVQCEKLYLVGDIVDMWAMKQKVRWPESHTHILKKIHQLSHDNVEVIYIPGNHDSALLNFQAGSLLGVDLRKKDIHTTKQGKRLLVVHGDQFDGAVIYRTVIRLIGDSAYKAMVKFNNGLHFIRRWLGLPYWSLATYLKENISQARSAIEAYEQAAVEAVKRAGLDGIVCGHIHKPAYKTVDDVIYCNDGDWTESCSAMIGCRSGELALLDWPDIRQLLEAPRVAQAA